MKRLVISYFGAIDLRYSRNKTNIDGLRQAGAIVHDVTLSTPVTPLTAGKHLSFLNVLSRLLRKLLIFRLLFNKWHLLASSDIIFVGYHGQVDVPFAYCIAKILRKKTGI
jgi:hypothetical protein